MPGSGYPDNITQIFLKIDFSGTGCIWPDLKAGIVILVKS
jgi:hypothetical protein